MTIIAGQNLGPYRIIEQLGSGGAATVFKAFHPALDRYVAIKVLHPALRKEAQFSERFKREARIVARLEHPHIIPVYDFNEQANEPYLVMRFIEGDTLKSHLHARPLSPQEILSLMRPVCQAIGYAHKQGVLHRDLKPSNIMVSQAGRVFVTDFGLARIMQAGESTLSQDMMVGTPQYISPEQARGGIDLDERTDVYSLGVILFEMLTGQAPFKADTPFAVIHDHIYTPLPLPSRLNPDLDPALERLLLRALAKNPDDRFETAEKLGAALEKSLGPLVTSNMAATPVSKSDNPAAEQKKSGAWGVWVGVGLAGLVTLGLLLGLLRWARINRSAASQIRPPVVAPAGDGSSAPPAGPHPPGEGQAAPPDADHPLAPSAVDLTRLADEARQQGHLKQARQLYHKAIEADRHYLPAYFELSELQYHQNDLAGGLATLEKAVLNNPQHFEAQSRVGEAYLLNRQPEAALAAFEEAAALAPHSPAPYTGQALALLVLEQNTAAKQAIDQALARDPDDLHARLAQAIYLHQLGARREALRRARQLFRAGQVTDVDRERARRIFALVTAERLSE